MLAPRGRECSTCAKATSAIGDAFAQYYPPLSPLLQFGVNWYMESYFALLVKGGYLITQWIPPSVSCIESIGRIARVSADNFVLAIPDVFEFFLDINQAQKAENAHIICKEHNTHNFIYAGALKAYFFASEISNVFYLDGTPVSCTFYNSYLCPTYTLAFADINSNMLCNTGDLLTQAYINYLTTSRISSQFTEAKIVTILACIIAPGDPNACKATTSSFQQNVVMLGKQLNDIQTIVVKTTNLFVYLFSPVFEIVYQSYFGPSSAMSGSQANQAYNRGLEMSAADLHTYVSIRHGANSCGGASNAEACAKLGENCEWMGARGGGCQVNTHTHLAFQKFPLEAALATLIISVADNFIFWPQYLAYLNAQRLASAFAFTGFSEADIAAMIGRIFSNMQEDQYFVILASVRLGTLAIRDNIFALIDFIRTFIFVLSRGVLPAQFVSFEKVMVELVNFAEVRFIVFAPPI